MTLLMETGTQIFVTGGSGYVGRNILRQYVAQGCKVVALARSDQSADVVRGIGATAYAGDLSDVDNLAKGMHGADLLIHAAADTNHGRPTDAQIETNLQGARNVYGAAKMAGVRRALHLSTEAVLLGGVPLVNARESTPYPARPAGAYSQTKGEAERIALENAGVDLEVVVMRPRFVWGRDDTTALPQLIEAAKSGKLAWIGGGQYLTSTTHIANLVHGICLVLEKGQSGEVYHITDGAPVTFRSFISDLLLAAGVTPPTKAMPRWVVKPVVQLGEALAGLTGGRIHGPMSWQEYATLGVEVTLDIGKAQATLGYQPVMSIADGMKEVAEYARKKTG